MRLCFSMCGNEISGNGIDLVFQNFSSVACNRFAYQDANTLRTHKRISLAS